MYKVGDYVLHKRELCRIQEIKNMFGRDYYVLSMEADDSLKVSVPVLEEKKILDSIMTKEDIKELIQKIPTIPVIDIHHKFLENEYKNLLNSGKREDLIRIIKTTYLRNQRRKEEKKRISEKDLYYFEKAEEYLYREMGLVLNMDSQEVKNYLMSEIDKFEKM